MSKECLKTNDTAYVFEGDGRERIEPLPQWNVPGHPIALRRATAKKLARKFNQDGYYYSAIGGTLWVILAYARYKSMPIVLHEDERFGGFTVEKVH